VFLSNEHDYIEASIETPRFIGTRETALPILEFLNRSSFRPEKWSLTESGRKARPFGEDDYSEILDEWSRFVGERESIFNSVFFHGRKPAPFLLSFSIRRFPTAAGEPPRFAFCTAGLWVRDAYLKTDSTGASLVEFVGGLATAMRAAHGMIAHTVQARMQRPPYTLDKRFPGIYWANFLGAPYIEFFGREKILSAPEASVRELSRDLMLLKTDERMDTPEMLESKERARRIRDYLGADAFPAPGFPAVACRVPDFTKWAD
jgi:hypothetical protein